MSSRKSQPILEAETLDNNRCTLYKRADSLIQDANFKCFCSFCYHFCISESERSGEIISTPIESTSTKICECKHKENMNFCVKYIEEQKNISEWNTDKRLAFNLFLVQNFEGKSVFEVAYPNVCSLFEDDKAALSVAKFNWVREDIYDIENRINFLTLFEFKLMPSELSLVNTEGIKKIFTLKFIDQLTSIKKLPDNSNSFGKVILLEDKIIKFFFKFYFEPFLDSLDLIDAKNLESLHPIARENTRKKNRMNKKFSENFFTDEFDIFKFALKLFERYVPVKSYKVKHSTMYYGILICKYLLEFGFLEQNEIEYIGDKCYSKLLNFKQFEDDIIEKTLSSDWVTDAVAIRKCYTEIMIHILYYRQDQEILRIMDNIWEANPEINDYELIKSNIMFDDNTIFEPDLGRKILEIILGYIMSSKQYEGIEFTSNDILNVMDNFLMLFSNINDPYLFSINLMGAEDLKIYKEMQYASSFEAKIQVYSKQIGDLRNYVLEAKNCMMKQETVDRLSRIMEDITGSLNFDYEIQTIENFHIQKEINVNNIFVDSIEIIEGLSSDSLTPDFIRNFSKFCKMFLFMNSETQSIFLQDYYFETVQELMRGYPMETLSIFYDVFSVYPRILLANPDSLFFFIDLHKANCPQTLVENSEPVVFEKSMLLIDILKIFLTETRKRDNVYLPEYDILIGDYLAEKSRDWKLEDFEGILVQEQVNMNRLKFQHAIKYYNCLRKGLEFRFTRKTFDNCADLTFNRLTAIVRRVESYEDKAIFMELFCELHIDFKNNLLNQRNGFYIRKPVDMQYDEDINVQRDYPGFFNFLLEESENVISSMKSANENEKTVLTDYLLNGIFFCLFKAYNLFSMIKPSDYSQIKAYNSTFEKVDDYFFNNLGKFEEVLGGRVEILLSKKVDDFEVLQKYLDEFLKARDILGYYINYSKEIIGKLMLIRYDLLLRSRKNMIDTRDPIERVQSCEISISMFSNLLDLRKESQRRFEISLKEKMVKEQFIDIPRLLSTHYRIFKHQKLSEDSENNIYLATMKETKSKDSQNYAYNLCLFIHNQLTKTYIYGYKTFFYMLIESFTNILFVATRAIQLQYYKILTEKRDSVDTRSLDKIYLQMKFIMNYVKHKNSIDRFYKETYVRTMLCLKFHQYLCDENFIEFKKVFINVKLPDDSVDRVQRFTTIYQRTTDLCFFHNNYNNKILNYLKEVNRPHLIIMCAYTFDCLSEFVGGPYEPAQLKIYRFIYDRYNGTLKRYMANTDSRFYVLKNSLCDFMTSMADGLNEEVVTFLTINYEISTLNNVMKNSLKQLYFECLRRRASMGFPMGEITEVKAVEDISLSFADMNPMKEEFMLNPYFSSHVLLEIAVKTYKFINYISKVRAKYEMYISDRNYSLQSPAHYMDKGISEEDLVTWKFLKTIVFNLEYITKDKKLDEVYYTILPKSFFLSKETKHNFFENEAERNSIETKIISLQQRIPIFESEMNFNETAFNKVYYLYRFVSAKTFYFLQVLCILFSLSINSLMLFDFKNKADNFKYDGQFQDQIYGLSIIQIFLSFFCLIFWFLLRYNLTVEREKQSYFDFQGSPEKLSKREWLYIHIWRSLCNQELFLVFSYHILMIILGLSLSIGFFAIDLLAIVTLAPTFKYIVKSITLNFDQFVFTYMFGIAVMFAYGIFVHTYFFETFEEEGNFTGAPNGFKETKCINLVRCLWALMNDAFRNGEGIRDLMKPESYSEQNKNWYFARLFIELSFFLIINILLLNIIFGITIDTFTQMRVRRQLFEYDSQNFCFMCHNQKYVFEKSGIKFRHHVSKEHNMWNYVNFTIMMQKKTTKDCNTREAYLLQKIKDNDNSWIPIGRAKSLENKNVYKIDKDLDDLGDSLDIAKNLVGEAYLKLKKEPMDPEIMS